MPTIADKPGVPLDLERIKARRKQLKLTQADVADRAGFSTGRQRVCDIEGGRVPNPELATLEALAKALEWTVGELLGEQSKRRNR